MPYGIRTQGDYMIPWKWATLASFATAIFTVYLMLYIQEIIHPIQVLAMVTVWYIRRGYNPRHHIISASVEKTRTFFTRRVLPESLYLTSMHQGKSSSPRRFSLLTSNLIRPDDDELVMVSCSGKQGALLSLPFPAEREDTVARGDFGEWLVKNIDGCMRVAEDLGLGVNRTEDLILVTGRHLARSWINVVFPECRGSAQVSFVARVSEDSGVHLEERSVTGGDLKLGPSGEVGPPTMLRHQPMLRVHVPDALGTRTYPRTNAYSFGGTVLFVS